MDKYVVRKKTMEVTVPPSTLTLSEKTDSLQSCVVQHRELCAPNDISKQGEPIKQVLLKGYPKNTSGRSFQNIWFQKFKWLEYSQTLDAVFCYPCRQFQPHGNKENAFTVKGYANWKAALDKTKAGFVKHAASVSHITAMSKWAEKENRLLLQKSVSTLLNEDILEKNRYYVSSIAEIIQFLVINELPMRGTYYIEENEEQSLFRNLFEFTMKKDQKLAECYKLIPKNASYLSPEIQNDIIKIMVDLVHEDITDDVKNADVPWFTLLEDGTKDKNNRENVAIGVRYVRDGKIFESILRIATLVKCDAQSFADLTLNILRESGLDNSKLLSQCYDGASVMSGKHGGVQAIIQQTLKRQIPYIHCFNHRLHLVIVKAINGIFLLKQYFDQCCLLYNFFNRAKVSNLYEGKALARLLEQRWSGHFKTTKVIYENYKEITEALKLVQSGDFDGDDIAKSIGLLSVIEKSQFRFCLVLMKKILEIIKPADKILQSHEMTLKDSITVIKATTEAIEQLRNHETFEKVLQESNGFVGKTDALTPQRIPRKRKLNMCLQDFIITERTGEGSNDETFAAVFYETIDTVLTEINRRFQSNEVLLEEICAAENLQFDHLNHLKDLGINIPSKEELSVVKAYLGKLESPDTFSEMYKQRLAYEDTYKLLAATKTFACSTAICESTFSVLTRINRPQRLSMSNERLTNLVFLAFEKKRTAKIDFAKLLTKFNSVKNRKLQMF